MSTGRCTGWRSHHRMLGSLADIDRNSPTERLRRNRLKQTSGPKVGNDTRMLERPRLRETLNYHSGKA